MARHDEADRATPSQPQDPAHARGGADAPGPGAFSFSRVFDELHEGVDYEIWKDEAAEQCLAALLHALDVEWPDETREARALDVIRGALRRPYRQAFDEIAALKAQLDAAQRDARDWQAIASADGGALDARDRFRAHRWRETLAKLADSAPKVKP